MAPPLRALLKNISYIIRSPYRLNSLSQIVFQSENSTLQLLESKWSLILKATCFHCNHWLKSSGTKRVACSEKRGPQWICHRFWSHSAIVPHGAQVLPWKYAGHGHDAKQSERQVVRKIDTAWKAKCKELHISCPIMCPGGVAPIHFNGGKIPRASR